MAEKGSRPVFNPLTVIGAILTTVSAVLFLTFFFLELLGLHANPYFGIFFFLILPGLFLMGLLLVPLGIWRERRRRLRGLAPTEWHWPRIDLNDARTRRTAAVVVALTLANIVIVSLAAFKGVEYMDSTPFCGEVCHTVMEPEYAAYQDGPHSRVKCVECHIGPGAPFFVKAKVDGLRQVWAVTFDTYQRPIPSPVHTLRPARDTCEQCHWPERFSGDLRRTFRTYADDEANTEQAQVLNLKVGGGGWRRGGPHGIHWHTASNILVEYIATDPARGTIPYVRMVDATGAVTEFVVEGVTPEMLAAGERRTMDCIDCHNRPTHRFAPSPERAVDAALASGLLPQDLPFLRREAVAVLSEGYPDRPAAERAIAERLQAFYGQTAEATEARVARAIAGTQRVFAQNVFPKMGLTWGAHPNHLGHTDSPGCFRCHDGEHRSKDGRTISQDCELCHTFE